MFDTLLDDFEDVDAQSAEAVAGGFRKLPIDENEEEGGVAAPSQVAEGEVQLESPDELLAGEEAETWSDDPVRMYLTQMGEIPLLTRRQEIELAKRIEETRRRFRTKLLENHYVLVEAYKTLKKVYRGQLPFDRTVQVSVTDRLEKEQIIGRLATQPADPSDVCSNATSTIGKWPSARVLPSVDAPKLGGRSHAAAAAPCA